MGMFDYKYTYIAVFITGLAFLVVSVVKTRCTSIRWPLFSSSLILLLYVVVNFVLKYFAKDTVDYLKFWYTFLNYTSLITLVLVLLDFLLFIPYKCSNPPMNGSGTCDNDLFYQSSN